MWLFDNDSPLCNPYQTPPFYHITQISCLPQRLFWDPYPHFHQDEVEVVFVTRGNFELDLPGYVRPMGPGSVVTIPPGMAHSIRYGEGTEFEHHAIRFLAGSGDGLAQRPALAERAFHIDMGDKGAIPRNLLYTIQELAADNGGVIDGRVQTLALAILQIVFSALDRTGEALDISYPQYANEILTYLQNHIYDRVTMESLSQTFHLSPSHISRIFSSTYHTSPINYLIYSRMRQARLLILRGDLSIPEIARRLSYRNTTYFSKAFTQFFGCSPEKYTQDMEDVLCTHRRLRPLSGIGPAL